MGTEPKKAHVSLSQDYKFVNVVVEKEKMGLCKRH